MRFVRPVTIFAITLATITGLSSCGGTATTASRNNVTGNWTGTLTDTSGQAAFNFTMSLNQALNSTVTAANVNFTSGAPCFQNVSGSSGTFTLNGNFNGQVANTLQLTVVGSQPGEPDFNSLVMSGTVTSSEISGSWALQGPAAGCTGSGTFTMSRTK